MSYLTPGCWRSLVIRRIIPYLPLLIPLFLLLPGLAEFPYPSSDARYSDLSLAHYPNAIYLRRTLLEEHRIPLWSPNILSGSPFAANPLSGLWYPPGWIALLLPLPLGFNLVFALHLLWGGMGMHRLLRAEGLSHLAALLGALSFQAMPKIFAHYGAGHLTLLYALSWTPWLLWASRKRLSALLSQEFVLGRRFLHTEALVLALIFMADVRWSVYAGCLWLTYSLLQSRRGCAIKIRLSLLSQMFHLVQQIVLAALLAAPLALPLVEFTRLSSRAQMRPEEILEYSLPVSRLLGLVFPDFGGFHEYVLYIGQFILILSILAIIWKETRRRAYFWIWAAGASVLLALGSQIPFFLSLAGLPLFNLLRVPSRTLFITSLALSVLASHVAERLLISVTHQAYGSEAGLPPSERRRGNLVLTAWASFVLALSAGVWAASGELPINFAWGSAFALIGAIWIGLRLREQVPVKVWFVVLVGLCFLDWGSVDHSLFIFRSPQEVLAEGRMMAQQLISTPGEYRIYSPSYSLPQHTAANYRLQLADGVDPLQLQNYIEFMQAASAVPWKGYSVTVPTFASGDPSRDNAIYRPDPKRMGWLNVRYVVSEYNLDVEGLDFILQYGETRLYENQWWLPRAWIQPVDASLGEQFQIVEITRWSPDWIELKASGPGLLVLSEIFYPGWQVWADGEKVQVEPVAGLLRGVQLETGIHEVVFAFHPGSLYLGLFLGAVAVLFLALYRIFHQDSRPRKE